MQERFPDLSRISDTHVLPEGDLDAVIRPAETRERLGWALSTLTRACREAPVRNIPL